MMNDTKDIDNILHNIDEEGSAVTFNQDELDLIMDALVFYKEMNIV